MLSLLKALGVSNEALTKAVLTELNLTREEAVTALAEQLGVASPARPEAVIEVTPEDVAILKQANEIQARILSA
jgi:hypothetical protein